MKRRITDQERAEFKAHIDEPRVIKAVMPKSSKLGPPRAKRKEEEAAEAALAMRRPEGVDKIDGNTKEKLKRGQLQPGARIDLHGMTEAAAHRALLSFLAGAHARGVRLALVVTGVGNPKSEADAEWMRHPHGVLKQMVPRWLSEKEFAALAVGTASAHIRHGGEGALYVYLRKRG